MSTNQNDRRPSGPHNSGAPSGRPRPGTQPLRVGRHGPPHARLVEKPKDFKTAMRRLLRYLQPHLGAIGLVLLLTALSTLFAIASPKIMGLGITSLAETIKLRLAGDSSAQVDFAYIRNLLLLLSGLYVASAGFGYVQHFVMVGVAQKTVYNMRHDVYDKLNRLPLKYMDSQAHGEILSRVTNDVDMVSSTLQQSITQILSASVTLIGVLAMMFSISGWLTLTAFATLPFYVIVTQFIASRSRKFFAEQQKTLGELNGHVEEMYTGHRIIKAFGREEVSINTFEEVNERLYNVGWKAQFISGIIMPLIHLVDNLGYILVCVIGGIFASRGSIAIGDIQAFIQYSRQFSQPINQTANIINVLQSTMAAAERVFEVLDEPEEIPDAPGALVLDKPRGAVRFENVDFGYEPGVPIIKDMNIAVSPGQTIAIVGPTGAGKTTLVNLLMRFYEIENGLITIDGQDIRNLKRHHLRSLFGMVLQDTWLFNGTIRENIAYGRENASEEEIIQAARAARADHFIRTLPGGYDTILNEEASNISQGQRQLLTIARAILANPAMLILDEATSNVDTRTEIHVQEAMNALMQGRTSFVIAHRLSTIRDADLILVMNEGRVIEQGTHEELLAANGFYAELYNSQFTGKGNQAAASS
jgi:ATP-binding cassette subfamily B multidrug efflux pump